MPNINNTIKTTKKLNFKVYDNIPDTNIVPNKSFTAISKTLKEWNPVLG